MINQSACKHLILKPDLEVAMVLRFEFYLREAIAACRQCGAFYLIKARDYPQAGPKKPSRNRELDRSNFQRILRRTTHF